MLAGVSSEDVAKPGDVADGQSQLQLAALQANAGGDGKTEAEKANAQLEPGDVDGDMNVEEERYEDKVEEAVRDKTSSGSGTGSTIRRHQPTPRPIRPPTPRRNLPASPDWPSPTRRAMTTFRPRPAPWWQATATAQTLTYAITGQSADSSQTVSRENRNLRHALSKQHERRLPLHSG